MCNEVISIPDLPNKVSKVIWNSVLADRNVFIVFDEQDIYTYIYIKQSIYGKLQLKNIHYDVLYLLVLMF